MISRDSALWWVGLIGGVIAALVASSDVLEIPKDINVWLMRISLVIAAASGWMKTSPLPSKQAAEVGTATAKVVEAQRQLIDVKAEHAAKVEAKG